MYRFLSFFIWLYMQQKFIFIFSSHVYVLYTPARPNVILQPPWRQQQNCLDTSCKIPLQEDLLIILFFFLSVCSSPENETIFFLSQKPDTCPKKVFVNCTVQWSESSATARGKNLCLRLSLGWSSLLLWTSISKKYPPLHKQTGFPIQLQYLNLHFGTVLQFVSVEVSKWLIHFPEVTRVLVTGRLQLIANIKVYLPDRIGFGRRTDHWRKFVRVWFGSPSACQIGALNLCFCRQAPRRLHCFQC